MLYLSQPSQVLMNGEPVWREDETKLQALYAYCKQDVNVERELFHRLIALSAHETSVFQLDHRINQRGIAVDQLAVSAAITLVEDEKARLDNLIRNVSRNQIASTSAVADITRFILSVGVKNAGGDGIAKGEVDALLADKNLPPLAREVLLIRKEAAKSSTAKLTGMRDRACEDGRLRSIVQYHGAGTGRWAGRGVQVQNFPRPTLAQDDIDKVIGGLVAREMPASLIEVLYGSPLSVMSDCLRGMMIAPKGKDLIGCDYNAIEARVLAWLAGEEKILRAFRKNEDVYKLAAADIYGNTPLTVTKEQRQIGKVATLALGYQGGKGAFLQMAKNYGIVVSEARAEEIKNAWREKNDSIVRYWYAVDKAAIDAVRSPGKATVAGPAGREVKYQVKGSFLRCLLPSKRILYYPYPKYEQVDTPWGSKTWAVTYMGENSQSKKWERQKGYGGIFVENITQAVARDLLVEGLTNLESHGYAVVLHVHDEIVVEIPESFPDTALQEVERLMSLTPSWAKDLPVSAEGWRGKRYRK